MSRSSSPFAGRLVVLSCFAGLLILGLAVYRDYGLSFDEAAQRVAGAVTVKDVAQRLAPWLVSPSMAILPPLDQFVDRDYGVAFEAPAVAIEALLRLTDHRDIFFFRHLLNFLVCLAGAAAVYGLARRRFGHRGLGLLAVAMLVLSPRLFAESFYNSKDAVFMAAFAIALNTMLAFVLRPRWATALLHAAATAFAIDIRIVALVLVPATAVLVALRLAKRAEKGAQAVLRLGLYLAAAAILVVAMWPWLWADPVGRFAQALRNMSHFVRWDGPVLYNGSFVRSTELPWHYAPVWIAITTPPLYLALFVVGTAATMIRLSRSGWRLWRTDGELQDLVFLGLVVGALGGVIVSHAVMYDGWRHLYFIYPAFLLVALGGWHALWTASYQARLLRPALAVVTLVSLVMTAGWMVRAHPYQNVYFNALAGPTASLRDRFELDYWGLAVRQGLEYVLSHDPSDPVYVKAGSFISLSPNFYMLSPRDRARVRMASDDSAPHYLFTNYRMERDISHARYLDRYDRFYQVKVDGEPILSVFKSKVARK